MLQIDGEWICPVVFVEETGLKIPVETGGELPQNFSIRLASKEQSRRLGGTTYVAVRRNFDAPPEEEW